MARFPRRPLTRCLRGLARLDAGGRWPVGWIGMLVLLIGTEIIAARLAPENLVAEAWRQTRIDADTVAREYDVLAVGDSQVKHGFAGRVLETQLGVRAYNLALQGATAPATYRVLRNALDAGAQPEAILLNSALLYEDPFNWIGPYSALLDVDEALELAWTARDGRIAGAIALSWVFPSHRERDGLRIRIKRLFTGQGFDTYWILQSHRRNWKQNLGSLVLSPPRELPVFEHAGHVASIPWSLQPVNVTYLERTLDLAAERGIPVYWLLYPIHPGVRDARHPSGWNAAERAFLEGLQASYPNLTVLDGLFGPDCPVELLSDLTHLNRLGAVAFSAAVAGAIAEDTRDVADRWITLPALSSQPAIELAAGVEDERQSLEALKLELRAERLRRKGLASAVDAQPEGTLRR